MHKWYDLVRDICFRQRPRLAYRLGIDIMCEGSQRRKRFADIAIDIFFDESCPLPKAGSNNDHYEAITGSDDLMSAIFVLWAVKNCPQAAELVTQNFSR